MNMKVSKQRRLHINRRRTGAHFERPSKYTIVSFCNMRKPVMLLIREHDNPLVLKQIYATEAHLKPYRQFLEKQINNWFNPLPANDPFKFIFSELHRLTRLPSVSPIVGVRLADSGLKIHLNMSTDVMDASWLDCVAAQTDEPRDTSSLCPSPMPELVRYAQTLMNSPLAHYISSEPPSPIAPTSSSTLPITARVPLQSQLPAALSMEIDANLTSVPPFTDSILDEIWLLD